MSENTNPEKNTRSRRPRRRSTTPKTVAAPKGRGGSTEKSRVPASVRKAVEARYGGLVRVLAPRDRGGFMISIKGAPRSLTNAMWVDANDTWEAGDGIVCFDSVAPGVRKRELDAARRLEAKGFTLRAAEIRDRVAIEMFLDANALKGIISVASTLADARSKLTKAGTKPVWHRHIPRGESYGPLTLDLGRGVRLHAGNGEETGPWYALSKGDTVGEHTNDFGQVLAQIS